MTASVVLGVSALVALAAAAALGVAGVALRLARADASLQASTGSASTSVEAGGNLVADLPNQGIGAPPCRVVKGEKIRLEGLAGSLRVAQQLEHLVR